MPFHKVAIAIAIAIAIGIGSGKTKTTTQVSHPSPNETVTETTTTSFGMGASLPQQTMIAPARNLPVFCEAKITVDANGAITAIQATQDTRGAGLSISRCAEVFDVNYRLPNNDLHSVANHF